VATREDGSPLGARVGLAELDADAHAVLARLRTTEPVSWVAALGGWLVTGYDAAVAVMRDSASYTVDDPRFSTARVVGRSMLSVDGTEHGRHRAPFVAPFRPAQVQRRFGAEVERLALGLVGEFRAAGEVELRRALAGPLSVAVVAEILGLEASDAGTVLGWYATIVEAVSGLTADDEVPGPAREAMAALADRVHDGLAGDALLGVAAASLTEEQVVSNAAVLMFGGIETTEGMILNAVRHLLGTPGQVARVADDPSYAVALVEESLRMEPAAAVVDRYATADVRLGEAEVRRGDLVRVSLAGANRDPAVFPDPDAFDPTRANLRSQLAFARGPHVCVAMDLARLEARVAVRTLVAELPGLRPAAPAEPRGLVFRKPAELRLRWD
jgi:cytochrome P450